MSAIDIDVSEIIKLANDLENVAPKQMINAAKRVTVEATRELQTRVKAAAPRDRPWLATRGIRRATRKYSDAIVGLVYAIDDERGRPVAFFVTYGASGTPPNDFMAEATNPARDSYPSAVLEAMDPFAVVAGSEVGDDEDA